MLIQLRGLEFAFDLQKSCRNAGLTEIASSNVIGALVATQEEKDNMR